MKRPLLAALLVFAFPTVAHASQQEVQGWRTSNDHIHTSFDAPMLGTLSAPIALPVTTLLHNRAGGKLTFVRWSDGSSVKQSVSLAVVGTGENEQKVVTDLALDPAKFDRSGWRELRMTSNFVASNGDREFTTTRTCIFVQNGKSRSDYCGGPTVVGRCGGGAWYAATDYSVAFVDCRDVAKAQSRPLVAGDTIRIKAQAGSLYANADPAFHVGNQGTVLLANGGRGTWRTVTIPGGLAPGVHKLHIRDQRSNGEVGAYVLLFTTSGAIVSTSPLATTPLLSSVVTTVPAIAAGSIAAGPIRRKRVWYRLCHRHRSVFHKNRRHCHYIRIRKALKRDLAEPDPDRPPSCG